MFWLRIIRGYQGNFEGFEESWKQAIHKTPSDLVKELALAVQEFFKFHSFHRMAPLHISSYNGHINICKLIDGKVQDKTPADENGRTPLHMAAEYGQLDVCKLIIEMFKNKILPVTP